MANSLEHGLLVFAPASLPMWGGFVVIRKRESDPQYFRWRVETDGSEIDLVAEADTRDELRRLHKRRQDWRYKVAIPGCCSR
jgi:hypothetical protein